MKGKVLVSVLSAMMLMPVAHAEVASEKQAKTVVEYRQSLLQLVRSNVGALGAMAKGKIEYDEQVMQRNGKRLEQLSLMMPDYFAPDTRKFDVETKALDKIWQQPDAFAEKITALTQAAKELQYVAAQSQTGEYKQAIGNVLKSCKGCHDQYKAD